MRKTAFVLFAGLFALSSAARPVCIGDTCYLSEEAARAAGVPEEQIAAALAAGVHDDAQASDPAELTKPPQVIDVSQPLADDVTVEKPVAASAVEVPLKPRIGFGYMKPPEFLAFLAAGFAENGREARPSWLARPLVSRRFEATPATWKQAFADARATGKPVFVDVWATWCKNCLKMERTTFKNADVQKALEHYAVIRLQAEKPEELFSLPEFKGLNIKGLPAFVVFKPEKKEKSQTTKKRPLSEVLKAR